MFAPWAKKHANLREPITMNRGLPKRSYNWKSSMRTCKGRHGGCESRKERRSPDQGRERIESGHTEQLAESAATEARKRRVQKSWNTLPFPSAHARLAHVSCPRIAFLFSFFSSSFPRPFERSGSEQEHTGKSVLQIELAPF